ncbi:hypothetical protein SAMN05421819_0122 [Bryocella elongata]|uniref:Uncharacterized protein n=1 Tax=Bryocella elongata TaxID=863522 RepID=A0A1H5SA16_9BACT|nr:hypothetical protein [Bryocella elongata]SEF47254.1 hypothetical protein SAMN05421819_0122 [Bryocella elongata]
MNLPLVVLVVTLAATPGLAQQVAVTNLPGIRDAEVRAVSPANGFPRIEVRDAEHRMRKVVRFPAWRNHADYASRPALTKFRVLAGPEADSEIILGVSGSGRADYCNVSVALIGVRAGKIKLLTPAPFRGDYPEGRYYWGELGDGLGPGLAHWQHARSERFDDRIRLTIYRYDSDRNALVKTKVMTTRHVIPYDEPNPLREFGLQYKDAVGDLLPSC